MTFLNDLFNKFKTPPKQDASGMKSVRFHRTGTHTSSLLPKDPLDASHVQQAETILEALDHHQIEQQQGEMIRQNLEALKNLIDQPKEDTPEVRFSQIKQLLSPPVQHETVRYERMHTNIHCPDCASGNIKRLAQLTGTSPLKHRYRCLDCGLVFNDDTGTLLERDVPPLNIWMQCWYLMGCTESLSYIATKLGLDLTTIEWMVETLRQIFKARQPMTRFIDYEEWRKQSHHLQIQLKEDLLKQYERLSADIATVPKDTTEFRRQQNLRRDLSLKPEPPSAGKKKF